MTEQPLSDTEPEMVEIKDPFGGWVIGVLVALVVLGAIFALMLVVFSSPGGQAH